MSAGSSSVDRSIPRGSTISTIRGVVSAVEERRMSIGQQSTGRVSFASSAGVYLQRSSTNISQALMMGKTEADRFSGMRPLDQEDRDRIFSKPPDHWTSIFVLRESNLLRSIWNAVVAALLVYTATVFPYKLCFMDMKLPDQYGQIVKDSDWSGLEATVDTLFWLDLVATFFFSYRDEQLQEVTSLRLVMTRYVRTTFAVNLLACVAPYLEVLLTPIFGRSSGSRAVPLLRLIRLLRLAKLVSWMSESPFWRWVQSLRGVKIFNFTVAVLWVVHLNACGWYLCAALHSDPRTTWVNRRWVYSPDASSNSPDTPLVDESHFINWLNAMYFGIVSLFTVGFGDIYAITLGEVMFVFCMLIEGAVVHAIVVSQMIHSVSSADNENLELVEKRALLRRFAQHIRLNDKTSNELVRCIVRSKGVLEGYDQEQVRKMVMVSLPDDVMERLHSLMFKGRLVKNRLISVCSPKGNRLPPRFPLLVALLVYTMTFQPGEMVYYWSDHAWSVYLVLEGTFAYVARPHTSGGICEVPCGSHKARGSLQAIMPGPGPASNSNGHGPDGKTSMGAMGQYSTPTLFPYLLFCGGSYFGEFEMFISKPRISSVRCEIPGTLLALSKAEFNRLGDEFPDFSEVWKSRTLRKEGHRKAALKRLTHGRSIRHFAAYTIQRCWRKLNPGADRLDTFMNAKMGFTRPEEQEEAEEELTSQPPPGDDAPALQTLDVASMRAELRDVLRVRKDLDVLKSEVHAGQEQVRCQVARLITALSQRRTAAGTEIS